MSDDKDNKGIKDDDLDKVSGGTGVSNPIIIEKPPIATPPHHHEGPVPVAPPPRTTAD